MPYMIRQDTQVNIQLGKILRAILQVSPGTGELHIGSQLTNITRALVKQKPPQRLRLDVDVCSNTATFSSKEGPYQFVALHHGTFMQPRQVDGHGHTPPERWQ